MMNAQYPFLGYGLGLRTEYYQEILEQRPEIDWFEILSDNYMVAGGKPLYYLDAIKEQYPIVMHGVSLSIGGSNPLDQNYLAELKKLKIRSNAVWVSDHLCWTNHGRHQLHDLMPLPYTSEAIQHVVNRIRLVQDYLECQILLENVSSYVNYSHSEMQEWDFYRNIVEQADCLMLLDVNNIYVSARNHEFDPMEYIRAMPSHRVQQIHIAGHTDRGNHVIDTHDHPVVDDVWSLYEKTIQHLGPVSSMIERDDCFPPFAELLAEHEKMRSIAERAKGKPNVSNRIAEVGAVSK